MFNLPNGESRFAGWLTRNLIYEYAFEIHLFTKEFFYQGTDCINAFIAKGAILNNINNKIINLVLDYLNLGHAGDVTGKMISQRNS